MRPLSPAMQSSCDGSGGPTRRGGDNDDDGTEVALALACLAAGRRLAARRWSRRGGAGAAPHALARVVAGQRSPAWRRAEALPCGHGEAPPRARPRGSQPEVTRATAVEAPPCGRGEAPSALARALRPNLTHTFFRRARSRWLPLLQQARRRGGGGRHMQRGGEGDD